MAELDNRLDELEEWKRLQIAQGVNPFTGEDNRNLPAIQNVEAIEAEAMEAANIGSWLTSNFTPRHLIELGKLSLDPEEKLELLSIYEGANWLSFNEFINREVELQGAIIWYHPPFKGKPDDKGNSVIKDGYYKILFLTTSVDRDGIPEVISCSSSALAPHVLAMLEIRGWYKWSKPVTYKFLQKGTGFPFRMISVHKPENTTVAEDKKNGKK